MIYMKHPDHGATHFYSEGEAVQAEKSGWVRHAWPPVTENVEEKQEIHAEPAKRRGRPPKVSDGD